MNKNINRRDFIKTAVLTTGAVSLTGCGYSKQLLGICETKTPQDPGCWKLSHNMVEIDLSRVPELSQSGSAIRLESDGLPVRILVVHADGDNFHAFKNRCTHYSGGRRIDPVPGKPLIRCCSIGKATFDYEGKVISGPAKEPLPKYAVVIRENKLYITL
jgi:Rieske Fe-S protein